MSKDTPPTSGLDSYSSECATAIANREDRDEVREVQANAARETLSVRKWRVAVILSICTVAIAVTWVSYRLLLQEQDKNFTEAFDQFSLTVANAAVDHQENLRLGFESLSHSVSLSVAASNYTWPFAVVEGWELIANDTALRTGAEVFTYGTKVKDEESDAWVDFAEANYLDWITRGHQNIYGSLDNLTPEGYHPFISKFDPEEGIVPDDEYDQRFIIWEYYPPPRSFSVINWNLASVPDYGNAMDVAQEFNELAYTRVRNLAHSLAYSDEQHARLHSTIPNSNVSFPHTLLFYPVYEDPHNTTSEHVASLSAVFAWDFALRNLLPEGVEEILVVLSNTCNQTYSYSISGADAFFLTDEDIHLEQFSGMGRHMSLSLHTHPEFSQADGHCIYEMSIYPTEAFFQAYHPTAPMIFAILVASAFAGVVLTFLMYDLMVQKRNYKMVINAAKSNAVVTALFPGAMRDRVIAQTQVESTSGKASSMKAFLNGRKTDLNTSDEPLAELFLDTTVVFADIVGFTAWSSVREPPQVFKLLESVFADIDVLAAKSGVFKVETVGDCYVAVAGVPEQRKDHAVVMTRFSAGFIKRFNNAVRCLEVDLGPDTGDLRVRVGIHSGPVTAGVLRGDRARFQLFGDTVNTAARMEHSSETNRIQASTETARLLRDAGKGNWLQERVGGVEVKGKGYMETYWLTPNAPVDLEGSDDIHASGRPNLVEDNEEKKRRLIQWNVEILSRLLKRVVARSLTKKIQSAESAAETAFGENSGTFLDEVKEIIVLPRCPADGSEVTPDSVQLDPKVIDELQEFVSCIAYMYNDNPFHNFEHASHVVMSVNKLLSRIVAPAELENAGKSQLHDHTYGITSDPLTQFACSFSALIHDVDHRGVSNEGLIKELPQLAKKYASRSVAEQHSLQISWDLLVQPSFSRFLRCLCPNKVELQRFRQLVVNSVMATDIFDKELKLLRNNRWDKAFAGPEEAAVLPGRDLLSEDAVNRKATIVIEHIIQASDVSHTMQHWHVYRAWNERLFGEMYTAYKAGRTDGNPAQFWAKGELNFFDFYVIPLAKKLKECGVFGISSDEYLNYAQKNREEWESKGKEIVAMLIDRYDKQEDLL